MKKHLFSNFAVTMLMAFLASFTLSSCSEEVVVENKQEEAQQKANLDIPEGAIVFSTADADSTRTSIDLNSKFYWTANDKIWVDVDRNPETKDFLHTFSLGSDDMEMSDDKRYARFIFTSAGVAAIKDIEKEKLEADPDATVTFDLTYTGTSSSSGTEVTIADNQDQEPDHPEIIGEKGDCATAVATRNAKGQYVFTLHHEAHYLILQPYQDEEITTKDWKLKKIEIFSLDNEPLSGTFDFGMDGLDVAKTPNTTTNTTITIDNIGGADGLELQKGKAADNPAWYVVIAPATDGNHRLRIRYTVYPDAYINYDGKNPKTKTDIVIVKDLPVIGSAANRVTKITHKMTAERVPTDEFYQWNATNPYWDGVDLANRPTWYTDANTDYPQYTTDNRFTTLTPKAPSKTSTPASNNPCAELPNVNAMTWYAMAGDARWDNEYPWRFDDDFEYIYTQGTWFKKWDVIVRENSDYLSEGLSYTDCPVAYTSPPEGVEIGIRVYIKDPSTGEIMKDASGNKLATNKYENRVYPANQDYRTKNFPSVTYETDPVNYEIVDKTSLFQPRFPSYTTDGRPNDITDYFILPVNGHVELGKLESAGVLHGCYWSSSAVPGSGRKTTLYNDESEVELGRAYIMETKDFSLWVRNSNGNADQGRAAFASWWK